MTMATFSLYIGYKYTAIHIFVLNASNDPDFLQ